MVPNLYFSQVYYHGISIKVWNVPNSINGTDKRLRSRCEKEKSVCSFYDRHIVRAIVVQLIASQVTQNINWTVFRISFQKGIEGKIFWILTV